MSKIQLNLFDLETAYKVVRRDSNNEHVIYTASTELEAKRYADECYKWDKNRIYKYEVRES